MVREWLVEVGKQSTLNLMRTTSHSKPAMLRVHSSRTTHTSSLRRLPFVAGHVACGGDHQGRKHPAASPAQEYVGFGQRFRCLGGSRAGHVVEMKAGKVFEEATVVGMESVA